MATATLLHSKKQTDKAGRACSRFRVDDPFRASRGRPEGFDLEEISAAMDVVDDFRAAHARPLARVNAGLRYHVKKGGMA